MIVTGALPLYGGGGENCSQNFKMSTDEAPSLYK